MEVLTNLIVVIVLKSLHVSNYHIVHLSLHVGYGNNISIKLG